MTLGSHIPGSPGTCVTRFRTRLVWLCLMVTISVTKRIVCCNNGHCLVPVISHNQKLKDLMSRSSNLTEMLQSS